MGPKNGRYFARAKVGGKLIRQSLGTATYSVAVLRLSDLLKENRGRIEINEAAKSGPMTFQQAADLLLARVDADPSLKPATRVYRRRCLDALRRTWPDLPNADVRRITPRQCQDWAADFAERYSETMYSRRSTVRAPAKGGSRGEKNIRALQVWRRPGARGGHRAMRLSLWSPVAPKQAGGCRALSSSARAGQGRSRGV